MRVGFPLFLGSAFPIILIIKSHLNLQYMSIPQRRSLLEQSSPPGHRSREAVLRATLVCTLAIVLSVFSIGCGSQQGTTDEGQRVRVTNVTYQLVQGGARILKGDLENLSQERIAVAQIDVSLFDANNRRVESMMVLVRNIEPGQSVAFREPVRSKLDIRGARARAVFVP